MNLNEIAKQCVEIARKNGFTPLEDIDNIEDNKYYLSAKIARIHSEVSEMFEAICRDNWNELIEEAIDVIICCLDFLGSMKNVNIKKWLLWKIEENENRPFRHGKIL